MASAFVEKVKGLPGLRAYWRLNDESGITAKDSSALGTHNGTYEKGQSGGSPIEGAFQLRAGGYAPFIGGDPTSTGVVFVSNCNRDGGEPPFGGLEELYAYGACVKLPEEGPLEAEKRALWAPTNQFGVGMFLEVQKEPNITANIVGPIDETIPQFGYSFQLNSAEHAEGFEEGIGKQARARQLLMYTLWLIHGEGAVTIGSKVLKSVSLATLAWANLIEGKTVVRYAGSTGVFPVLVRIIKAETTPGVSKDGELELNAEGESTVTGTVTVSPEGFSNVYTKHQLAIGHRYFAVCVYNGGLPASERIKWYLNGEPVATVIQPTQPGNVAVGGVPAATGLIYSANSGLPPRLGAVNGGGSITNYSDSFPGRFGEVFLTTVAPSAAVVKELSELANAGSPSIVKPADQTTAKNKAVAVLLAGENIVSYKAVGLPAGLKFSSGVEGEGQTEITGTMEDRTGTYTVKLTGTNGLGESAPEVTFKWTVEPAVTVLVGANVAHTKEREVQTNRCFAGSFVAVNTGTMKSIEVHGKHSGESKIVVGIWSDAPGKPGSLLGETTVIAPEAGIAWGVAPLITPLAIAAGVTYWIGVLTLGPNEYKVTSTETTAGFKNETPTSVTKPSQITKWKALVSPIGGVYDIAGVGLAFAFPATTGSTTPTSQSGRSTPFITLAGSVAPTQKTGRG